MSAAKTASSKTSLTPSPVRAEHSVYAVAFDCRLNDLGIKSAYSPIRFYTLLVTGKYGLVKGAPTCTRAALKAREGLSTATEVCLIKSKHFISCLAISEV